MSLYSTIDNKASFVFLLFLCVLFTSVSYAQAPEAGVVLSEGVATTSAVISEQVSPNILIEKTPDTPTPIGDYVVGPGRVELQVVPGQTVTRYVTVANRIADGRTFTFEVEDMSGSADGSESVVLLGGQNGPYSLRNYISFPVPSVTLELNTKATIPVTISIPPNAEPGGYYGSVLVSTQEVSESGTAQAPRSPMIARVGTLFFITVPGEISQSGQLQSFSTTNDESVFQSGPIDLNMVFGNTGSVHLNPYGEVRVTNLLGDEVGFVVIDPWFVLPQSLRLRELTWDREFLLGRYTFTLSLNRGYDDIVDVQSYTIWVLPWTIMLGTFVVLFFIFFVTRFFFRTFEFKRRA